MSVKILQGDCRDVLAVLPAESVHCVVTSPPYWGLRDYGIPPSVWGGDGACEHVWGEPQRPGNYNWGEYIVANGKLDAGHQKKANAQRSAFCCRCGAWRGAHGLEPSIDLYVRNAVEVFRAVHRVLRPDGTLWLNLGDSYNNRTKVRETSHQPALNGFTDDNWAERAARGGVRMSSTTDGMKEKDLCGIPWRIAFALQADGWYLRQDIIWAKPNPMPESVTDRCTKSHEYIFLLSKGPRYFYDAEAIKEEAEYGRREWSDTEAVLASATKAGDKRVHHGVRAKASVTGGDPSAGRNKRSVWTVATHPYPEAHFATFPPDLIEPCIKAGTSEKGCCRVCGAPWERETQRIDKGFDGSKYGERAVGASGGAITGGTAKSTLGSGNGKLVGGRETLGWQPTCKCGAPTVPCIVLDCFGGSGTTGLVADRQQRNAIIIELNPSYGEMAKNRLFADAPLFAAAE